MKRLPKYLLIDERAGWKAIYRVIGRTHSQDVVHPTGFGDVLDCQRHAICFPISTGWTWIMLSDGGRRGFTLDAGIPMTEGEVRALLVASKLGVDV